MQQIAQTIKQDCIKITPETSQLPLYKAIHNATNRKIFKSQKVSKIFKPPRIIAIHKKDIQDNYKFFELEIAGNSENSYITQIFVEKGILYGHCFCSDFYYRKRACKHILASVVLLKNQSLI